MRNTLVNYLPYEEEIITTKVHHCYKLNENPDEPCWGSVIQDSIHLPNYREDPTGTTYYVCVVHYCCPEGGCYVRPK